MCDLSPFGYLGGSGAACGTVAAGGCSFTETGGRAGPVGGGATGVNEGCAGVLRVIPNGCCGGAAVPNFVPTSGAPTCGN